MEAISSDYLNRYTTLIPDPVAHSYEQIKTASIPTENITVVETNINESEYFQHKKERTTSSSTLAELGWPSIDDVIADSDVSSSASLLQLPQVRTELKRRVFYTTLNICHA